MMHSTPVAQRELPPLATTKDLADYGIASEVKLLRMREDGTGPTFIRIGRSVRYRREDVLVWLASLAGEVA